MTAGKTPMGLRPPPAHSRPFRFAPGASLPAAPQRSLRSLQRTAFEAEGVEGQLYAATLADALAVHILRRYAGCGPVIPPGPSSLAPAKLRRVTTYIAAHLAEPLALATLAAVVQLSPNHFASLFRRATGRTPWAYVLACRLAQAKQLLAELEVPLSAIGPQVGWTDQSYFTALFRKHVAMTPKAYRDATQRA